MISQKVIGLDISDLLQQNSKLKFYKINNQRQITQ
jgi:hypothetical protein